MQSWWSRIMGWVQVACWCHLRMEKELVRIVLGLLGDSPPMGLCSSTNLAWEARSRLVWSQEAAGNVRLVGDWGWPLGELSKVWGGGCSRWEGFWESSRPHEVGTLAGIVAGGWGRRGLQWGKRGSARAQGCNHLHHTGHEHMGRAHSAAALQHWPIRLLLDV